MKVKVAVQDTTVKIPIVEIFVSISGEGGTSGEIVTFIRTAFCNLRCSYCDTKYSYEKNKDMTIGEIIDIVRKNNTPKVVLTGGEPLFGKEKRILANELSKYFDVYIETNGSMPLLDFNPHLHYVVDYKSKSSGMNKFDILDKNIHLLNDKDEIKFVLSNKDDFQDALTIIKKYQKELSSQKVNLLFGTVFGNLELAELVELLKEHNDYFVNNNLRYKLNVQLHKFIWDPNKRGV